MVRGTPEYLLRYSPEINQIVKFLCAELVFSSNFPVPPSPENKIKPVNTRWLKFSVDVQFFCKADYVTYRGQCTFPSEKSIEMNPVKWHFVIDHQHALNRFCQRWRAAKIVLKFHHTIAQCLLGQFMDEATRALPFLRLRRLMI